MNYKALRSDIETYTGNSDSGFLKSINRFIRQAESKIGMLIELPNYVELTSISCQANNNQLDLSNIPGFISVNDIGYAGYGILEQKDTSFVREAYPDGSETGPPRYFAMQNNTLILLGPTPDQIYNFSLEFFGKWPSLVDYGQSSIPAIYNSDTFISANFETALLNGALYYANLYMKDAEGAQMFKTEMEESLGLISKFGKGKAKEQMAESSNNANSAGDNS